MVITLETDDRENDGRLVGETEPGLAAINPASAFAAAGRPADAASFTGGSACASLAAAARLPARPFSCLSCAARSFCLPLSLFCVCSFATGAYCRLSVPDTVSSSYTVQFAVLWARSYLSGKRFTGHTQGRVAL